MYNLFLHMALSSATTIPCLLHQVNKVKFPQTYTVLHFTLTHMFYTLPSQNLIHMGTSISQLTSILIAQKMLQSQPILSHLDG